MMEVMMVVLGVGATLPSVWGYGSGADPTACVSLMPGHKNVTKQTSKSPYTLDLGSATSYYAESTIKVKIIGAQYGGFLLQARKVGGADTTPVGTWMAVDNTQTRACSSPDSSLTHTSSALKGPLEFIWKAPASTVGDIEFVATVAEKRTIYWMGHKSSPLTAMEGDDPNPEPEPEGEGDAAAGLQPLWASLLLLCSMLLIINY